MRPGPCHTIAFIGRQLLTSRAALSSCPTAGPRRGAACPRVREPSGSDGSSSHHGGVLAGLGQRLGLGGGERQRHAALVDRADLLGVGEGVTAEAVGDDDAVEDVLLLVGEHVGDVAHLVAVGGEDRRALLQGEVGDRRAQVVGPAHGRESTPSERHCGPDRLECRHAWSGHRHADLALGHRGDGLGAARRRLRVAALAIASVTSSHERVVSFAVRGSLSGVALDVDDADVMIAGGGPRAVLGVQRTDRYAFGHDAEVQRTVAGGRAAHPLALPQRRAARVLGELPRGRARQRPGDGPHRRAGR